MVIKKKLARSTSRATVLVLPAQCNLRELCSSWAIFSITMGFIIKEECPTITLAELAERNPTL